MEHPIFLFKMSVLHPNLRHLFLWSQHRLIINNCSASITSISSVPLPDTCLLSAYYLKYSNFNPIMTIIWSQKLILILSNFQLFPSTLAFYHLNFIIIHYYHSLAYDFSTCQSLCCTSLKNMNSIPQLYIHSSTSLTKHSCADQPHSQLKESLMILDKYTIFLQSIQFPILLENNFLVFPFYL